MEIKKLRAFFHLLDMEKGGAGYIKITRKMKTFYGYIGIIRNIQLHLVKINDYCENVTCQNRGVCFKERLNYTCNCLPGYSGRHCEISETSTVVRGYVTKSNSI